MKKPVNLTLHTKVLGFLDQLMELEGQTSISAYTEQLIRNEYERRNGPLTFPLPSEQKKAKKERRTNYSKPAGAKEAEEILRKTSRHGNAPKDGG